MAAPVGADADELDAQLPLAAAEFALEHACEQVADDAAFVDRGELRVQRRLAARGLQAALDVAAPGTSLDGRVDGDDAAQIGRGERADRGRFQGK